MLDVALEVLIDGDAVAIICLHAGVAKLRQALRSNPATREALAKRGIDPGQVAGAQISSNGSLRLYIFSR